MPDVPLSGSLRVLGIDPGSRITGWSVLEGSSARPRIVDSGVIRLPTRLTLAPRLGQLQHEIARVVQAFGPGVAAVEAPFHGVNARSALQLAHARGAILATLGSAGVDVAEYAPAAIKSVVAGSGRAEKGQVRAILAALFGAEVARQPDDQSDALAVALCHLTTSHREARLEQATGASVTPAPRGVRS